MATIREDTANATRNLPISDALRAVLSQAADAVGIQLVVVTSGGQPASGSRRVGSNRHDNGNAADLDLQKNGKTLDFTLSTDLPDIQAFVTAAASAGATGIGAGVDYMGPTKLHVGFGPRAAWGKDGKAANAPPWLIDAATSGWNGSPAVTAPPVSANPADIEKRRAPGTTAFADLQTMVGQSEALLGPLVAIENDGTDTIVSFDQAQDVPATPVVLERDADQEPASAGFDQLVASGICIVAGSLLSINAYRVAFRGVGTASSDIPPEGRALLDTIAGTESPGYDVIFGGQHFTDFSHHPDIAVPINSGPNQGKFSTAAGRYQFIFSTWSALQQELQLPDFSPVSQDKAAWHLAQTEYQNRVGRPLLPDLQNHIFDSVGPALHNQWTSLPGGIEQGVNANRFVNNYLQNLEKYLPTATA